MDYMILLNANMIINQLKEIYTQLISHVFSFVVINAEGYFLILI